MAESKCSPVKAQSAIRRTERPAPIHLPRCFGLQSLRHELPPLLPISPLHVVVVDLDRRRKLRLHISAEFSAHLQALTYQRFLLPCSERANDQVGLLLLDEERCLERADVLFVLGVLPL